MSLTNFARRGVNCGIQANYWLVGEDVAFATSAPLRIRSNRRLLWVAPLLVITLLLNACASNETRAGAATARASMSIPAATYTPIAPGWRLYTDSVYGFAIQYPPGAILDAPAAQVAFSSMGWRLASATDPADSAALLMTVTPQPSASLCAEISHGAPISIGSGISAHQFDNLTTPAPAGAKQSLQRSVLFTSGDLFTIITLSGNPPESLFLQRWGTVWRDTLASYKPGHGPPNAHPCA